MKPVDFRTLTPIWTGGFDRRSSAVRESGILGGLRWWYEGLIRAFGGFACDPTAQGAQGERCRYDPADSKPPEEQICPSCLLFGCTGWKRRFGLDVGGVEPESLSFFASRAVYEASGNWLWRIFGGEETGGQRSGRGSSAEFTFGATALWAQAGVLRVGFDRRDDETRFRPHLDFLLHFVSRWGGVGAKLQFGFGQVEITGGLAQDPEAGRAAIAEAAKKRPHNGKDTFFDVRNLFSARYSLDSNSAAAYRNNGRFIGKASQAAERDYLPCAFDIRYKSRSKERFTKAGEDFGMRPWFRAKFGWDTAQVLFGNSRARSDAERAAGRIGVSHLFRPAPDGPFYLKVWGDVPAGITLDAQQAAGETKMFLENMFGSAIREVEHFDRARELKI